MEDLARMWNKELYGIFQNAVVNVPRICWEWTLNVAVIK